MVQLPRVEIGRTGLAVSRLGLGGFHQVEVSSEVVAATVDTFLAHGGNYIETARAYGDGASEEKLGRALAGRRDEVVLATKSQARDADGIRRDLEASLSALDTDHIEFFFFHGVNSDAELDVITAPGGALAGLAEALDTGVIRGGLGLSSHRTWLYLEALERLPLSVILIWHNYLDSLYLYEIPFEIFPAARARGVTITAMKPLADGFLHRSPGAAVRYCLGTGADVVVSGMNAPKQVEQLAAAVEEGAVGEVEVEGILKRARELGRYVCRGCGTCPPELMELFALEGRLDRQMLDYLPHGPAEYALRCRLADWFGLAEEARGAFAAAAWEREALLAAGEPVRCPYGIDVARKVRLAWAKLASERPERI